ncbi:unnamed protein product [Phaeothamnion confervicola]
MLAARRARRALRENVETSGGSGTGARKNSSGKVLGAAAAVGVVGGGLLVNKKGDELEKLYRGSPLEKGVDWCGKQIGKLTYTFTKPVSDKLLPDWPPMPNVPPDTPCPPTLVLDLEETLVASVWDPKHGWRSAKRPGVDKFLKELANYYEIAVITAQHAGVADPILTSLDDKGYIMYRLCRESTRFVNGKHVKDLSNLNRDIRRIVVVDKDPECFQLQPENGIVIKPFRIGEGTNPGADRSLELLLPFLKAIAVENVQDVRPLLQQYRGMDANAIGLAYRAHLDEIRAKRAEAQDRGLGGLVRKRMGAAVASSPDDCAGNRSAIPSSREIVGAVPPPLPADAIAGPSGGAGPAPPGAGSARPLPPEKVGGLWRAMRERAKRAEEDQQRKMEAFHNVMMKKEEQRKSKAAAAEST